MWHAWKGSERHQQWTYAAKMLLEKINEIQRLEDVGILNDDDADMEDCEDVDSETDSNVSQQNKNKSTGEAGKPDRLKRVYRLKQEIPTRWNSCLAMLKSLLQMHKEVDNCIKMIGQYDKCLKASEWAVVEEL